MVFMGGLWRATGRMSSNCLAVTVLARGRMSSAGWRCAGEEICWAGRAFRGLPPVLCSYGMRPPISQERLSLEADRRVRLDLKRTWPNADGATALIFEPVGALVLGPFGALRACSAPCVALPRSSLRRSHTSSGTTAYLLHGPATGTCCPRHRCVRPCPRALALRSCHGHELIGWRMRSV